MTDKTCKQTTENLTGPSDVLNNGWNPNMEEAPRDGTWVLLGRFVDKCQHGKNALMAVDYYRTIGRGDSFTGWGRFNETYWPATHWRPLPPPPERTQFGEGDRP